MYRTRTLGLLVATAALGLSLTACSDDSSDSDGSSDQPVTVDITEKDGKIEPVGKVVKASTGQDITLVVTSDVDDEIHVHSDPEHEFEYGSGTTTLPSFTIDKPGIVEVESHGLEKTIVQLEVK